MLHYKVLISIVPNVDQLPSKEKMWKQKEMSEFEKEELSEFIVTIKYRIVPMMAFCH